MLVANLLPLTVARMRSWVRARQARRRVDDLRAKQRREIVAAEMNERAGLALHEGALRQKATRNAAERLIDLEEEETANTMAQCVGHGLRGRASCAWRISRDIRVDADPAKFLTHFCRRRLDDELNAALRELRLASKALKVAWHKVSGPVRHKQQEMLAATSDHRAARLRWEAQQLSASLAHMVTAEKDRVSPPPAQPRSHSISALA